MSTIKTQESESAIRVRIGPRMRELRDVVSTMPGCSRADALRAAGLPTSGLGSGRPLDRRNTPNRDNGLFSGVLGAWDRVIGFSTTLLRQAARHSVLKP